MFDRCCWVVLLVLVRGLTFLACACAFDGFLLWFLLVSASLPSRLFVTDNLDLTGLELSGGEPLTDFRSILGIVPETLKSVRVSQFSSTLLLLLLQPAAVSKSLVEVLPSKTHSVSSYNRWRRR